MEQIENIEKLRVEEGACIEKVPKKFEKRGYDEKEAAIYLAVSRSFLRQGRMNGLRKNRTPTPVFVRKGRRIKYLKEDLDEWLEEHQWIEKVEDKFLSDLNKDFLWIGKAGFIKYSIIVMFYYILIQQINLFSEFSVT